MVSGVRSSAPIIFDRPKTRAMAKVFISYSSQDRGVATDLASAISLLGHYVLPESPVVPGTEWRSNLIEGMKDAEVIVVLLTDNSTNSPYFQSEVASARVMTRIPGKSMLLIPVIWDRVGLPNQIRDIQALLALDHNLQHTALGIDEAITAFEGRRLAEVQDEIVAKARIEENAATYVEDAIRDLRQRESINRVRADVWYYLGYLSLVSGVGVGVYGLLKAASGDFGWEHLAYFGLKSIITVGLLLACSKYSFTLGKSYMSEALKSADRIHAISFGRFYLRAYGLKTNWIELKEVFQNWNIDRPSSFASLETSQFDPKFVEAVVEVAKAMAAKAGK